MRYLLLPNFLRDAAARAGASPSSWRQQVFDDLVATGAVLVQRVLLDDLGELSVHIGGARFFCQAKVDTTHPDSLFVFRVNRFTGDLKPLQRLEGPWIGVEDASKRSGIGSPIDFAQIAAEPFVLPTFSSELRRSLVAEAQDGRLGARLLLAPPGPTREPRALVPAMRNVFNRVALRPLLHLTLAQVGILRESGPPPPPALVADLHRRLGTDLLERVQERAPALLPDALELLLAVPPPLELLAGLAEVHIDEGPGAVLDRVRAIHSWVEQAGQDATAAWAPGVVQMLRQRELLPATADPGEWPALDRIAGPLPAATLAPEAAATIPAVTPARPPSHYPAARAVAAEDLLSQRAIELALGPLTRVRGELVKRIASARLALDTLDSSLNVNVAPKDATANIEKSEHAVRLLSTMLRELLEPGLHERMEAAEGTAARFSDLPMWRDSRLWYEHVASHDELVAVADVLGSQHLDLLPAWFWRDLAPAEFDLNDARMLALAKPEPRRSVLDALLWLGALSDEDRLSVVLLARPDGLEIPPHARLRSAFDTQVRAAEARNEAVGLGALLGPWTQNLLDDATNDPIDLARNLRELRGEARDVEDRLPSDGTLRKQFRDALYASEDIRQAYRLCETVERALTLLGSVAASVQDLSALQTLATMIGQGSPVAPVSRRPRATMSHCFSNEGGSIIQAPLTARATAGATDICLADVPLRVETDRGDVASLRLRLVSRQHEHLPAEYTRHLENLTLNTKKRWRREGDSWVTVVVLPDVPIPRRERGGALSSFELQMECPDESLELTCPRLSFPVSFDAADVSFDFKDRIGTEEMLAHRVGLQHQLEQITRIVGLGDESFLVAAPRRFGKTTLLDAVRARVAVNDVVVVAPVNALDPDYSSPVDVFRAALRSLCKQLSIEGPADVVDPLAIGAFDQARRRARAQGARAIYLIFDEAQALFRRRDRAAMVERIKHRIEREWGRTDGPFADMTPIRLGFCGQLHLLAAIEGQLDAAIVQKFTERSIREADIWNLLRVKTGGRVASTSSARRLLASEARNIFLLRILLRELIRHLNAPAGTASRRTRAWFTEFDVDAVVDSQLEEAATAPASDVRTYLRESLNRSDDSTRWEPGPEYPVAIAWASTLDRQFGSRAERLAETELVLNRWCRQLGRSGRVLLPRVEQGLQELRLLDVLDQDDAFRSGMLGRFLGRLSSRELPLVTPTERDALGRLLIEEVDTPTDTWVQIGEGGQARVYRDGIHAYRIVTTKSEDERKAFIETCRAIAQLESTRSSDIGFAALQRFREYGFARESNTMGVFVYDWIDGIDLSARLRTMSDSAVAQVGARVASAIALLAQRGVLHRDVRPENLLLRADGQPVLIDFGLSRILGGQSGRTQIVNSEYVAPEAKVGHWTPAADVYSLGKVLQALRRSVEDSELAEALRLATTVDEKQRPVAADLRVRLENVLERLRVRTAHENSVAEVELLCSAIPVPAVRDVAMQFVPSIGAAKLGMFDLLDSARHASMFLDEAFVAWLKADGLDGGQGVQHITHLDVESKGFKPGTQKSVVLQRIAGSSMVLGVGYLRHTFAHANDKKPMQKAMQKFGTPAGPPDPERVRAAVLETALLLGREMGAGSSLQALLDPWLSPISVK